MAGGQLQAAIGQLRRVIGGRGGCRLSDAQLLEDFVTRGDQASFEVLVWRHGALVLSLCQRVLRDNHAAEDAFQATFLVFARKAGSIGRRAAVGGWLYRVAYRVALRLRSRTARRSAREEPAHDLPARAEADEVVWRDLRPVLDEEIGRLPEKYRVPFVLCYLEGHTNAEAAEQLGCPKGTILSRLTRGRDRLRSRLARRGVTLSAAGLAVTLTAHATAAVPAALVNGTIKAALPFAAGQTAAGLVSASVAALADGIIRSMLVTKLKAAAAALVALAVLVTGTGLALQPAPAEKRPGSPPRAAAPRNAAKPEEKPAPPGPRPEKVAAKEVAVPREEAPEEEVAGRVLAVAGDGRTLTLEMPSPERGGAARQLDVRLGPRTAIAYDNVGPDGARPTRGYGARVRHANGAAAAVVFQGSVNLRAPDLAGRVAGVARGGSGIALELPSRERGRTRPVTVRFTRRTQIRFSGVGPGGARLAEDYEAQVWLDDDSRDTAAAVTFLGPERSRPRQRPDLGGTVRAVARDGRTVTLELPARRGEEPATTTVRTTGRTSLVFEDVGPNGARLATGLQVRVWLADHSRDTATHLHVIGPVKETGTMVAGRVVTVAADGRTITLELPGRGRGEGSQQISITLTDRTRIVYSGVGQDGARPTAGYAARVRLKEGSRGAAARVWFSRPGDGRRR